MPSKKRNPKRSKKAKEPALLIISGGKLATPSAPLSVYVGEFLEEQFGLERSESPELFTELGWIDQQGNAVGDHTTHELLGMEFDAAYVTPLRLFDQLGPHAIELGLRRVEGDIPGYPFDHVVYTGTAERLQGALAEAEINVEVRAHLFTRSEHLVLSSWLRENPTEALESIRRKPPSWEVYRAAQKIARCGGNVYADESGRSPYHDDDAAVATILLRSIERNLPNWGTWSPETGTLLARNRQAHADSRKLHLMPMHLFTINWASSGFGFSWPAEYNLSWVPLYERYVVTVSADSPEGLAGYTDLGLGSFGADCDIEDSVRQIVVGDWYGQFMEWNQEQWADILEEGLISRGTLMKWAREVWSDDSEGEDSEDEESD